MGVFGALAINYINLILRKATLGARYSIDKVRFIEYYIIARNITLNAKIICNAWEKAGLLPYNPDLILQAFTNKYNHQLVGQQDQQINLTLRPTTPPEATVSYSGPQEVRTTVLTPINIK